LCHGTRIFLSRKIAIVAVFSFAGFLSACAFVSYARKVDAIYKALPNQVVTFGNPSKAYQEWYQANTAATPFADWQWVIFALGFPVAISVALIATKMAGWLRHIDPVRMLPGVVPIFVAPGLALLLTAVLLPLALLGMALAAGLIVLSLKIITARWSTLLCLCFLASGAACIVLWFVILVSSAPPELPGEFMVSTIELIWGGIFGLWLAVSKRVAAGHAA
jgi:hypothetical protein